MKLVYNGNTLAGATAFPDSLPIRSLSREEYDALTDEEKEAEALYLITDVTVNDASALSIEEYDTEDGWHVRKWSDGYVEMTYIKSILSPNWKVIEEVAYTPFTEYGFLLPVVLVERYSVSGSSGILADGMGANMTWDASRHDPLTECPFFFITANSNRYAGGVTGSISITGHWK